MNAFLVDCDAKRMHFFGEIIAETDGRRAAAFESLSMCVDLEARKSAVYPDWAQARMQAMRAAQADIPMPKEVGPDHRHPSQGLISPAVFVNGAQQLTIVGSFWQQSSIRYPINPPIAAKSTR